MQSLSCRDPKKICADQLSGRRRERAQLAACLDYLREGDVLAITRVDRLGRSLADLITQSWGEPRPACFPCPRAGPAEAGPPKPVV